MNRRSYLSLVGAAVTAAAAGCLGDDTGTPADGGSTASPSRTATRPETASESSAATYTATTTPPPIEVETPAPGECEAPPRPDPSTGEGLPNPRDYPDPPDRIEPDPVRSFLEAYEAAYRYNERLADLAEDGACVEYLETSVEGSTVWRTERGIVGEVATTGSFTGTTCPDATGTDTATPLPHGDYFTQTARYLVTDRFLVREGGVVECWG